MKTKLILHMIPAGYVVPEEMEKSPIPSRFSFLKTLLTQNSVSLMRFFGFIILSPKCILFEPQLMGVRSKEGEKKRKMKKKTSGYFLRHFFSYIFT